MSSAYKMTTFGFAQINEADNAKSTTNNRFIVTLFPLYLALLRGGTFALSFSAYTTMHGRGC